MAKVFPSKVADPEENSPGALLKKSCDILVDTFTNILVGAKCQLDPGSPQHTFYIRIVRTNDDLHALIDIPKINEVDSEVCKDILTKINKYLKTQSETDFAAMHKSVESLKKAVHAKGKTHVDRNNLFAHDSERSVESVVDSGKKSKLHRKARN